MKKDYDVVVIGAGSAGLTSAVGFSKVGKSVLLIEKAHMGGECTNSGCIPSKALLHHAKMYHTAKKVVGESAKGGLVSQEAPADYRNENDQVLEAFRTEAFNYVRNIIDEILEEETPEVFEKMGIDVVSGDAMFTDKCSITVGNIVYGFKTAIIATGSSPRMVSVSGLNDSDILTNQNIFELKEIPKRLLIVGGGPIGLEMAQAFAMLGSQVTIAERSPELGRLEDPVIRPILKAYFTQLGITIETNAAIQKVVNKIATFDQMDGETVTRTFDVAFDKVLIAIGRVPNLPQGLEAAGINADEHCIQVDSQHRTSNKHVYAIGDVAQRLKFTHTADDIARQVVTRVVSKGLLRLNTKKSVPKVTYTTPEIAQVGMNEQEAIAQYGEDRIMRIDVPYTANDRAKTDNATDGHLVVIARRLNGQVLGANLIGPAAGELLAVFSLAIDQKISMWKLRSTIFAYPTYSLVIKKAGDYFFAQQVASLKKDMLGVAKRNAPKIVAGIFWAALIYGFHSYRTSNDLSYIDVLFSLIDFFTSSFWGPVIYMVLYAVRPLIFFPATLLTALSGALFGLWWGILYTVIGENASANFAYWIGRFFGKDLRLEDTVLGSWVEKLRNNTFEAVLLMRLFYFPFDLTNYGSGIVKAKWREYFLATLIGIMPGLTTFVALGAAIDLEEFRTSGLSFDAFDPKFLAISVAIFVGSLILSRLLKRWKKTEA